MILHLVIPLNQLNLVRSSCIFMHKKAIPLTRRNPQVAENPSRMECRQHHNSNDDQRSLKNHKSNLVIRKMTLKSVPKLRNTVHTTHENEQSRREKTPLEPVEAGVRAKVFVEWCLPREVAGTLSLAHAERKVAPESEKMIMEIIWEMRPAITMWTPRSLLLVLVAIEAMAPPIDWRTRESRSQPTKM